MFNNWKFGTSAVFIAIPVCSFIVSILSLLRYGIDLPYWDDWGPYITGNLGSLDLKYLFQKANDTLMPVGYMLESLVFRYLNGNAIAWQILSMVGMLSLLLLLQWRLLRSALNDRLLAASAFTLTLVMLQPYSYWGLQGQAYIQGLPLVFCLACIYISFCENWSEWGRSVALFILGFLAGFSYITGAFAIMAISVVFLSLGRFINPDERKPLLRSAWVLFAAGLIPMLAQLSVIILLQKGTHRPDMPMAFPIEGEFWFFLLGNLARSLRLQQFWGPAHSLALISIILAYVLILIFLPLYSLIRIRTCSLASVKPYLIFIAISSMIFVYLSIISAGRAAAQFPGEHSLIQVFFVTVSGSSYFFWATLLWPWVAASSFVLFRSWKGWKGIALSYMAALLLPLLTVPSIIKGGMTGHAVAFEGLMGIRMSGMQCISNHLQHGQDVDCPQIYPGVMKADIFLNGKEKKASFMRLIAEKTGA